MKFRRTGAVLSLALSAALTLGACTSPDPEAGPTNQQTTTNQQTPTDTGSAEPTATDSESTPSGEANPAGCLQDVGITAPKDGEVRYTAGPGPWDGYNSITSGTYSTYNSAIAAHMFSSFTYFGTDGTICENKDFGTMEVVSENPLEVKYTISDKAVWSDGTPVTINDYLMDWASQNPEWLVPGYANETNPDAKPLFDSVSASFAQYIPEGPQGEVDSKTFTIKYNTLYPDYKILVGSALPAHVIAKKSGLDPKALAEAILKRDKATVEKTVEFWNKGWIFQPQQLPADMSEVPSSGPYVIKPGGWDDTSLTLEANDKYWGTPPATKDLVFRFFDDAASVQALQNGDVQVIQPQATIDTLGQLEGIGAAVTVEKFSTLTWEHLDFNFRPNNVFSDGPGMGGLKLRQAFVLCVPRQQIVDTLIKPIQPDAVVMNAREVFPFQQNYKDVVAASYNGEYDNVDLAKSKALVTETGLKTPITVRIGYRAGNERRANEVAAIAASCKDAGFDVQDVNAADFFSNANVNGDYELALYAWAGSGQIASGQNIYATGKPQNTSKYSNKAVDDAWTALSSSLDPAVHLEQTKIIEKQLWDTLFGIPLFAHPGIAATDSKLQNIRPTATQDQISWNAFQWVAQS